MIVRTAVNDIAVEAVNLRKVYRLYSKPSYRFLDMFGLLGQRPGAFTEHAALDGIDLVVKRGEKVAIIGRNGAGKSTFLKLVTRVIAPTAGELRVNGDIHALLQIGTGFHPDFTGRENVRAYLAQLGVTGADADRRAAEAIEFAELEEYIDQPVKTYSTGMSVRLMFSASTTITPDLLVLDEVLGVGDAYFAHKSYDRIRQLCDRERTTLLLVTHDVYSAARLCPRVVWIDRGAVLMDGDATTVVKAYEESIRLQEEHRLRVKNQAQLARNAAVRDADDEREFVTLEIQAANGPQPSPVYFARIALMLEGREMANLPLDAGAFGDSARSHLVQDGSCWGEPVEREGRPSRPMMNYGSPFHKVVGVFAAARSVVERQHDCTVVLDCWSEQGCRLLLRAVRAGTITGLGEISTAAGEWTTHSVALEPRQDSTVSRFDIPVSGVQGAGDIVITSFAMVDEHGRRTYAVRHGDPVCFRTAYTIRRQGLRERAQVFIVITRNTTERVCKFMTSLLLFDDSTARDGVVELRLPRMMLGAGTYSVAIEIAAEGYADSGFVKFFSIDPRVYQCITEAFEFTVTTSGWIGAGTIFEGEGEWRLCEAVAS